MIYGVGVDIVELKRIQLLLNRYKMRFCSKIFSKEELNIFQVKNTMPSPQWTAARFAGKEATVKALGTGFTQGISFKDIVILNTDTGQPKVFLKNQAARIADEKNIAHIHISLTHEKKHAVAMVILEL